MIPRWDSHPQVKQHGVRSGTLIADWFFDALGTRFFIVSPFKFNGASVPIPFWWVAMPFSAWVVVAALVHDWLYRYHMFNFTHVCVNGVCRPITRREADRLFLQILIIEINRLCAGDGRIARLFRARLMWRARAMYAAVRKFAGAAWLDYEIDCKKSGGKLR